VTEHYDVVIIGSGAGGGTLAHVLAPAGQRILLLERGDFLPREMANWQPGQVFVDGTYISPDTWYDSDGQPFQPQAHYFVGGATKMYGAALYRLRPADFGEIRYPDGVSPAWPLSYDDFEPWYTRAEWLYQVHGAHGEDPTEGYYSKDYPWPAVSHEPRIQRISDALAERGYQPFHAPCGILLDEADRPASNCIRCAWCDGYPCLVHAKADAETIAVRPLLTQPNVTLLVGAEVTALRTDQAGRTVTGVEVSRYGRKETYAGDIVVVAAGAANSARILLRSACDAHPDGLANASGQVGRNYMFHNSKAVVALDSEPNETVFQKTLGLASSVLDVHCKAHDLDNLYVVDASFFPSIGAVNPALTVMANAMRVGDHLLDRMT
jgi:choline dehydrogenase-like flavoprotein